jgi:hypothetical protein
MTNIKGECKKGKIRGNANLYEEAVNEQVSKSQCVFHPSPFLVGTLSLVSYAETNIVAPNLLIWELDLQDILL